MTDGHWPEVPLAALAKGGASGISGGPFGSALGRKDYVEAGVPVIRGAQLGGGSRFSLDDLVFVSEEKADRHPRNLAFPGDIIVTQRGTLGQVGVVPRDAPFERYLLSQSQMKITVDDALVDTDFLYFAMRSAETVDRLRNHALVAGVPHINLGILRNFGIRLPALETQRRLGRLLAAFDDLIEVNERRIELLEDLARSLYREWFVRFRFPGHECAAFVESKLGSIPEGWDACPLFDIADVGFGYSFKSARFSDAGPYPVVRIRDVLDGVTTTFTDETADPRYAVYDGDVLVGMDGEFHLNQWSGGEAWLNQRVARLRPITGLSPRHLMLATAAPIRAWNDSIVGTTVAHLGKRHLETIQILVPPGGLLQKVTTALDALAGEQLLLVSQNRRLAATRDLLLPRLVTGRLDISDLDLGDLLPEEIA